MGPTPTRSRVCMPAYNESEGPPPSIGSTNPDPNVTPNPNPPPPHPRLDAPLTPSDCRQQNPPGLLAGTPPPLSNAGWPQPPNLLLPPKFSKIVG